MDLLFPQYMLLLIYFLLYILRGYVIINIIFGFTIQVEIVTPLGLHAC
jgi:hypothetical protein